MNTENTTNNTTGTKEYAPSGRGEKIALWLIGAIIFYLVFIDK